MLRVKTEEGHYTIKRVDRLPDKGNANWLYTFKELFIKEFYRWDAFKNRYEIIKVGETDYVPPVFKVVENRYSTIGAMYLDQGNQTDTFIQYVEESTGYKDASGKAYFEYLGTTNNSEVDYRKLTDAETVYLDASIQKTSDIPLNDGPDGINPYITSLDIPPTNLTYTPSPTQGTVNSDTGTDAVLPLADGTNAGLITPAEKTSIGTALQPTDNISELTNDVGYITSSAITGFVPYTGATSDVDLGELQLKTGQLEFDQTPTGTFGVGKVRWNDVDGTTERRLKGNNVTLQDGQEVVKRVVNKTGADLLMSEYKVVRLRTTAEGGSQGQRSAVLLAQADSSANSTSIIGVVTETITNNGEGFITLVGEVREIDTTGSLQSETWLEGDQLYLSATVAGNLTNVIPVSPNYRIPIATVDYVHAVNGKISVHAEDKLALDVTLSNGNNAAPSVSAVKTYVDNKAETDPIFQASEAALFVAGDKTNLDNQSGVNTGDETTVSIQTKRPLKTVDGQSLEGAGDIPFPTSTADFINQGADNTSTYVEFDDLSNYVTLNTQQTIVARKTFNNVGTGLQNIISNNSLVGGAGGQFNNSASGGFAIQATNTQSNGFAIYATGGSGKAMAAITGTGDGFYSNGNSSGRNIFSEITGSGNSIVSSVNTTGTGFAYVGQNNLATTFTVDKLGNVTGNSFIKSGGTSSQFLKADGSIDSTTYQSVEDVSTKTTDYVTVLTDGTILVDATTGNVIITLITPVGNSSKKFTVKKIDSTVNTVTVSSSAGIDGTTTKVYSTQYAGGTFQSNGTQYYIIGNF